MHTRTQYISSALISTPPDPKDPNANTMRVLTSLLPLMVGWFSLNVPSGLGLYYLSNTLLTTLQQVYLRKLGGASVSGGGLADGRGGSLPALRRVLPACNLLVDASRGSGLAHCAGTVWGSRCVCGPPCLGWGCSCSSAPFPKALERGTGCACMALAALGRSSAEQAGAAQGVHA